MAHEYQRARGTIRSPPMGLFSKNWTKELDRAEDLLQRDLPVPALEIAERVRIKVNRSAVGSRVASGDGDKS